jgi:hypothetical protein
MPKFFSRGAPPRLSYSPGEALANTGKRLMIDRMKIFAGYAWEMAILQLSRETQAKKPYEVPASTVNS